MSLKKGVNSKASPVREKVKKRNRKKVIKGRFQKISRQDKIERRK